MAHRLGRSNGVFGSAADFIIERCIAQKGKRGKAKENGKNGKEKNLRKAGFVYVFYIALVTLPDLMHLVHTFFLVTVPFSSTFTV